MEIDGNNWIVVATSDEKEAERIKKLFESAKLLNRIYYVNDGGELLSYLTGAGSYGKRASFPLPKLILVDPNLPGINGLEILKIMQSDSTLRKIPALVLTDEKNETVLDQAYESGAASYLAKNFSFADFLERSRLLNTRWMVMRPPK